MKQMEWYVFCCEWWQKEVLSLFNLQILQTQYSYNYLILKKCNQLWSKERQDTEINHYSCGQPDYWGAADTHNLRDVLFATVAYSFQLSVQ